MTSAGRRVLVVEDDWLVARELEAVLRRAGFAVVGPVAKLDQAVRSVAQAPPDAAVLDVNLAGERVFPAADALAARRIPFVFLTGCGADVVPERFWRRPTLRKPLAVRPLLALLEAATLPRSRPAPPRSTARMDAAGRGPSTAVPVAAAIPHSLKGKAVSPVTARALAVARIPPRRRPNADLRPREHLTAGEVGRLLRAAARRPGRHGPRDAAMVLLAYRHGLRAGELVDLRWDQVDLEAGLLRVRRLRNGEAGLHALGAGTRRALRRLSAGNGTVATAPVFASERGGPMTPAAFRKQLAAAARVAGLPFPVHPHMLRHACGMALARAGRDPRAIQAWLGHRNARHAARYAGSAADG